MKLASKTAVLMIILFSFTAIQAQIKNTKTATVTIYGNCEMCKNRIEKAGNGNALFQTTWNVETKKASIVYDAKKTSLNAVLKKIALAGHDNAAFFAPNKTYNDLPECCRYKRKSKSSHITK